MFVMFWMRGWGGQSILLFKTLLPALQQQITKYNMLLPNFVGQTYDPESKIIIVDSSKRLHKVDCKWQAQKKTS